MPIKDIIRADGREVVFSFSFPTAFKLKQSINLVDLAIAFNKEEQANQDKKSRSTSKLADQIADVAILCFQDVSGAKAGITNRKNNKTGEFIETTGPFVEFLKDLFILCGVSASAPNKAKEAITRFDSFMEFKGG